MRLREDAAIFRIGTLGGVGTGPDIGALLGKRNGRVVSHAMGGGRARVCVLLL